MAVWKEQRAMLEHMADHDYLGVSAEAGALRAVLARLDAAEHVVAVVERTSDSFERADALIAYDALRKKQDKR